MHKQMVADLLEQIKGFAQMDIEQSANMRFLGLMRTKLVDQHFSVKAAERIAMAMDVALIEGTISDEQLEEFATHYAIICKKMYQGFDQQYFDDPEECVCQAAHRMTLKFS